MPVHIHKHIIYEVTPLLPKEQIHVYKFLFQSVLMISYQHINITLDFITFKLQQNITDELISVFSTSSQSTLLESKQN